MVFELKWCVSLDGIHIYLMFRSIFFIILRWLDVKIKFFSDNLFVDLKDIFTCTLEVAGSIVRRSHPEVILGTILCWVNLRTHRDEHLEDISEKINSWLYFLFRCFGLDCG